MTQAKSNAAASMGLKKAFGGVVIRADGKVLLREPRNHFDGYVWTFAKGRPNDRERDEEAALREVLEETGLSAKIVGMVPGDFAGGTTVNRYYLMEEAEPGATLQRHDMETSAVKWATHEEAKALIGMSTNAKGRERDLAVLEAAYGVWEKR